MAKGILSSILIGILRAVAGTSRKKTTTAAQKVATPQAAAQKASGSPTQTKSASAAAQNLSPAMKAKAEEVWNKPIATPKGWTRTTGTTYSSS